MKALDAVLESHMYLSGKMTGYGIPMKKTNRFFPRGVAKLRNVVVL